MKNPAVYEVDTSTDFRPEGAQEPSALGCLVILARHHGLHLSVSQLIHDNMLSGQDVSQADLLKCAQSSGLRSKAVRLKWNGLSQLNKALPAIVTLKNGASMVLRRFDGEGDAVRVILQDPNADEDGRLVLDRIRFEQAWTGDVILVKRDYEITDEKQPFSIGLIAAVIFRERWIVRDVAICAVVLGFVALTPVLFMRVVFDRVLSYRAFDTLTVLCVAVAILFAFEALFFWLRRFLVLNLTARADVKLSTYLFERVLNLRMDFFERTQVGTIVHDFHQLYKIRNFLMGQLFGTVLDSTTILVFLPVMFFFSPTITFVVLGLCGIIVAWLLIMLPTLRRKTRAAVEAETQRGAFLVQTIHGIRTVKSLALDARQRHLWDVHTARTTKLHFAEGMTANSIQALAKPIDRIAVSGAIALAAYFAITNPSDPYSFGAMFAFVILTQRVVAPLVQMAQLVNQYDDFQVAVETIGHLANQPEEEGRTDHGVRTPLQGHVQFSNVTFKYKGTSSPALQAVTFEAPRGTIFGIMGKSGSGKTTITRLLQRLHSDYDGLIKIDGIDVREYDVDHLRRSVGVVLQENFLFSGTIRENIAAAKPDATFDEVVYAARMAGAEEFIDRLPRGYETHIYEGSPNLSGGQRQRLAIARALIIDPRVLILDEATSALDPESEAILNENLSRIAHGRTLIVVSHRLGSLVSADAILVLDGGQVQDIGRHEELLNRCEIYARLWHQQNSHLKLSSTVRRDKPPFRNPSLVP
jgi:subfamily B ATP-binding cassette protein HlyB/CyaB